MPLLKGLNDWWKYVERRRQMLGIRGIYDMEEIPSDLEYIIVCFKVFVCICKMEVYVMLCLAKYVGAWSCFFLSHLQRYM